MAFWQERLNSFNKQQEKCLADSKTSNKTTTSTPRIVPASIPVKPPLQAVKFSNDTERLQRINTTRKSPAGAQIKQVIDLLFKVHTYLSLFVYFLIGYYL